MYATSRPDTANKWRRWIAVWIPTLLFAASFQAALDDGVF
jgi:hypothetical protein